MNAAEQLVPIPSEIYNLMGELRALSSRELPQPILRKLAEVVLTRRKMSPEERAAGNQELIARRRITEALRSAALTEAKKRLTLAGAYKKIAR